MIDTIGDTFDTNQFGAIKIRFTSHALVVITHKWYRAFDEQQAIRVVCTDNVKAFDHIDYPTVIKKLDMLGVPPITLQRIHPFLMACQQQRRIVRLSQTKWRNYIFAFITNC